MNADDIINNALDEAMDIIDHENMRTLAYLGEQCVRLVRERPRNQSWTDRTGNLRSSIGFALAKEGDVQVTSSFDRIIGPEKSMDNGSTTGKNYAEQLAKANTNPYALILVAGMEYAPYVEAKGYDVLAGAEAYARSKIGEYLVKTQERINKKLEKL